MKRLIYTAVLIVTVFMFGSCSKNIVKEDVKNEVGVSNLFTNGSLKAVPLHRYYNAVFKSYYFDTAMYPGGFVNNEGTWSYLDDTPYFVLQDSIANAVPVYQYYNPVQKDYYYSPEFDPNMGGGQWPYQKVAFYGFPATTPTAVPVYSYFSTQPGYDAGHLLNTDVGAIGTFNGIPHARENITFYAITDESVIKGIPLHRYYNATFKSYYYDTSLFPGGFVNNEGTWNYLNDAPYYVLQTPGANTVPVYQYYNPVQKDYYYSPEFDPNMGGGQWPYQKIAFYGYPATTSGAIPIYSYFSTQPGYDAGHLLNADVGATGTFDGISHARENITFYAIPAGSGINQTPVALKSFYDSNHNDHYYGFASPSIPNAGPWTEQDAEFKVYQNPDPSLVPIYRYYNNTWYDSYLSSLYDPNMGGGQWGFVGIGFYASAQARPGFEPVYGYFCSGAMNTDHIVSKDKGATIVVNGRTYVREIILFYAEPL